MVDIVTVEKFAKVISDISKTDRWVLAVCSGDMGEGKSRFMGLLLRHVAKYNKTPFTYADNLTFSRKELKTWIDGDKAGKHQKPDRSCILADELISMFFKRNWYDSAQIDGIELLNKCRDRHLIVGGNIPDFLELDSSFLKVTTFWIHIHERGRAWVIQKDRNPFVVDKWHIKENSKIYARDHNPYKCKGFVCEIHFPDFTPEEREEYYDVRNTKRKFTEGQREKEERYGVIKDQRDKLIRLIFKYKQDLSNKDIADIIDLSPEAIRLIKDGLR